MVSGYRKSRQPDEDYVLLTNADNYYAPIFIETMLIQTKASLCWIHLLRHDSLPHLGYKYHTSTPPHEGGIDMGALLSC